SGIPEVFEEEMARLMDNRGKVLFALENADQPFSVGSRFYFPPDIVFIFSLIVGIQYIDRFIVEHDESPTILPAFVGNAFNASGVERFRSRTICFVTAGKVFVDIPSVMKGVVFSIRIPQVIYQYI